MCIHHMAQKIHKKTTSFMPSIILSVLLIIILLELIWWGVLVPKSLFHCIYTCNIVILTSLWLPVIGAILIQNR